MTEKRRVVAPGDVEVSLVPLCLAVGLRRLRSRTTWLRRRGRRIQEASSALHPGDIFDMILRCPQFSSHSHNPMIPASERSERKSPKPTPSLEKRTVHCARYYLQVRCTCK